MLSLDGEDVRSGSSSAVSGAAEPRRNIPGICTLDVADPWSERSSSSTWFFLKAGELRPLSAVWRNQAGSFEARFCAIWSLEKVGSVADAGSGVARGDREAFSVATIERGRLRGRSDACELGRRCHERGERGGIVPERGAFMPELRLSSVSDALRPFSYGSEFSLVGESAVSLSIALSWANSRSTVSAGDNDCIVAADSASVSASVGLTVVGEITGEDFVGDIDLARSGH